MKCPFCSSEETRVIDSRLMQGSEQIRRRRECEHCFERFTTLEIPQLNWPRIVKRDQRREQFLEHKLRSGVLRAFQKLSVPTEILEQAVSSIKKRLISTQEREISSEILGEWVLEELKLVDSVAYIRFASVYKRFESIEEFYKILDSLPQPHKE
ncbi:transcriptional repressor NrdR [bacterium]|nr:transcriptional repressor NrdR [bacterium]NBW57954.1 transcriptional repressor NrdR [bacterium]NBX72314.1 transcriptional repressor NrdR [bacterium]